jgi:hypothetical protein
VRDWAANEIARALGTVGVRHPEPADGEPRPWEPMTLAAGAAHRGVRPAAGWASESVAGHGAVARPGGDLPF